jgi:uncharacterized protein YciI
MQFIVLGYDGKDEGALDRRMAAREAHLAGAKAMFESKKWLYAAAILDDEEKMRGSMIVCEFPSREELDAQWLNSEPYVTGNVWQKIDVHRAQVPPFLTEKSS